MMRLMDNSSVLLICNKQHFIEKLERLTQHNDNTVYKRSSNKTKIQDYSEVFMTRYWELQRKCFHFFTKGC